MQLVIPNMIWHGDRERILTIAFHPYMNQLVTGGSDEKQTEDEEEDQGYIKIWELTANCQFKFQFALSSGHEAAVNCIKFSPNGQYMASGSDDKKIIIWERRQRPVKMGAAETRLTWCETKPLHGHAQEVYDLNWSRNGLYLVSCGLDKNVNIWSVEKGKLIQTLDGHTSYVQGVAFDPKMKIIVSMSQDRTARVWKSTKSKKQFQFYNAYSIRKSPNNHKLFLDENLLFTFVRRPDFSPDGNIFILPAARYENDQVGALLFLRHQPQTPAMFINTNSKPVTVVKFCPLLFQKESQGLFELEYKMVFALATIDQVIIYSTESTTPMAVFGNMHFASITDLSFKKDQVLGVSSCDGFCSFIFFNGDLGKELQGRR